MVFHLVHFIALPIGLLLVHPGQCLLTLLTPLLFADPDDLIFIRRAERVRDERAHRGPVSGKLTALLGLVPLPGSGTLLVVDHGFNAPQSPQSRYTSSRAMR